MVLKTITLVVDNSNGSKSAVCSNNNNINHSLTRIKYWKVSSQEALEGLLRRYGVNALVDVEYATQVTDYIALQEGVCYALGETAAVVELQSFTK